MNQRHICGSSSSGMYQMSVKAWRPEKYNFVDMLTLISFSYYALLTSDEGYVAVRMLLRGTESESEKLGEIPEIFPSEMIINYHLKHDSSFVGHSYGRAM